MYRIILIAAFIIIFYLIIQGLKKNGLRIGDLFDFFGKGFNNSLLLIKGKKGDKSGVSAVRNLLINITWVLFLLMALSAMVPVMISGERLEDIFLVIHVIVAPFFVISLMITVLLTIERNTFNTDDWNVIKGLFSGDKERKIKGTSTWIKILTWIFVIASIPAASSILLSMYPVFSSEGQAAMLLVHQYSVLTLLFSGAGLFYFYFLESKAN